MTIIWRPMETAPRDGSIILLLTSHDDVIDLVEWAKAEDGTMCWCYPDTDLAAEVDGSFIDYLGWLPVYGGHNPAYGPPRREFDMVTQDFK